MSKFVVTKENFAKEVEQATLPVMLDFWAPWCGYCRRIGPAVEQVAAQREGKMAVGMVNIDEQPELAARFGVEVIPTLMVMRSGAKVGDVLVAPGAKSEIDHWLEATGVQ